MHCKPQLSFLSYHAHFKLINYVYNMTVLSAIHLYLYLILFFHFNAVNVVPSYTPHISYIILSFKPHTIVN